MSYGYHYPPRQRYSRWDGTQQISDFTADDIMSAISDDMLNDGDLQRALQRLFRWGMDRPYQVVEDNQTERTRSESPLKCFCLEFSI